MKKNDQMPKQTHFYPILIWFYRNSRRLQEFKAILDKNSIAQQPLTKALKLCYGLYYYFVKNYDKSIRLLV